LRGSLSENRHGLLGALWREDRELAVGDSIRR
jgi:hypothetical protein